MSRFIYIGGFGNGEKLAETTAEAIANRYKYENVDAFTFSYAYKYPERVIRAANGVPAVVHSAGVMALVGAKPTSVDAFSPLIPTSRTRYFGKVGVKTVHMLSSKKTLGAPRSRVLEYNASAIAEISAHPVRNIGPLMSGKISKFDTTEFAQELSRDNIPNSLIYTNNDEFFQPTYDQRQKAINSGSSLLIVSGVHDQLVLTPDLVLEFAAPALQIGR